MPYEVMGQLPRQGAVGLHQPETQINDDILVRALQPTSNNQPLSAIHLQDPLSRNPELESSRLFSSPHPSLGHWILTVDYWILAPLLPFLSPTSPSRTPLPLPAALRLSASISSTRCMTARRQKDATVP
jgi:hypothetical protein